MRKTLISTLDMLNLKCLQDCQAEGLQTVGYTSFQAERGLGVLAYGGLRTCKNGWFNYLTGNWRGRGWSGENSGECSFTWVTTEG